MTTGPTTPERLEAAIRPGRVRKLRLEVELEFDTRIPLPDGFIVTAIADGLLELDRQDRLFPGVEWPRHLERLLGWSVQLAGSGGSIRSPSPVEGAMEQRRREGDLGLQAVPTSKAAERLREEANGLLDQIDDLEPGLMQRAQALWTIIIRLRHVAARLEMPETSLVELRAAIKEAKDLIAAAH